jgi:hypothetical protein
MKEASGFFLKKRTRPAQGKKLLLNQAGGAWRRDAPPTCGSGTAVPAPAVYQKFFSPGAAPAFFQKRSARLSLTSPGFPSCS